MNPPCAFRVSRTSVQCGLEFVCLNEARSAPVRISWNVRAPVPEFDVLGEVEQRIVSCNCIFFWFLGEKFEIDVDRQVMCNFEKFKLVASKLFHTKY